MNTKSKFIGIVTAATLAAGSIAIAPAVNASTVAVSSEVTVLSTDTKTVLKELKKVEQHTKDGVRSAKRATATCLRLSKLGEKNKNRARLVQQAQTFLVSAIHSLRAGSEQFWNIDIDFSQSRQKAAYERVSKLVDNGYLTAEITFATCYTIPEMKDFLDNNSGVGVVL